MGASLQIGQVAKKTGLTVDTIRFYEKKGLVPSPARTEGDYRRYRESQIADLEFIQRAQQLGFFAKRNPRVVLNPAPPGRCLHPRSRADRWKASGRAGQNRRSTETRNGFGRSITAMPHGLEETVKTARLLPRSERNQTIWAAKESRMKVEILYFSGCPLHPPAVECVRGALADEGTAAEVVEVQVKDMTAAQRIGFLGSPTIRVDGKDVEPTARLEQPCGMSCRTYLEDSRRVGVPPAEWIRTAIREAKRREQ